MARATWTGALEFGGFPVHLAAYSVTKSTESFKTLCPDHDAPAKQRLFCAEGGEEVQRDACRKGVEPSKGVFVPIPADALEAIKQIDRSDTLTIERFSPRDTVPLHLATGHFKVAPNPKMAGSSGSAAIVWNGLRSTGNCLMTEWSQRAGARPKLVAIFAEDDGLAASELPYATDLRDTPEWQPEENEQAAQTFEQFVAINYTVAPFEHEVYEDTFSAQRERLIEQVLAGVTIEAPAKAEAEKQPAPDLMAAMQATLASPSPGRKGT